MEQDNRIVVFQEKGIRRVWHNDDWYYSVLDVIEALAETSNATDYFKKMRQRDEQLKSYVGTNCPQVEMEGETGKKRKTLAANNEALFRIIQSIPSPKAEPFKLWLAQLGRERLQEIEDPERAAMRAREYYKALGYTEEWIERRMQSIAIRTQLTEEWKNRGVQEGREYSILTAEISRATFGLAPSEYKELKGLKSENLRDHMTGLELIFTMLGEEGTRIEAIKDDAQGFNENRDAAIRGGIGAGKALDAFEESTGNKVVTSDNFKQQIKEAKKKQKALGKKKDEE
jgi:hypothetical protein